MLTFFVLVPSAEEVLELENAGVVVGQVLLGVPHRGAEALQTPILLEPDPRHTHPFSQNW